MGSTGSIGTQALEVIREHKEEFRIDAIAAHSNVDLLEAQVREFRPKITAEQKQQNTKN